MKRRKKRGDGEAREGDGMKSLVTPVPWW